MPRATTYRTYPRHRHRDAREGIFNLLAIGSTPAHSEGKTELERGSPDPVSSPHTTRQRRAYEGQQVITKGKDSHCLYGQMNLKDNKITAFCNTYIVSGTASSLSLSGKTISVNKNIRYQKRPHTS